MLGSVELLRLESMRFAIPRFSDIENDSVCVKVGSGIAVHGPGAIVLKFRRNHLSRCLGRVISSDARLNVAFKLVQSNCDALSMGFSDRLVASDQSRDRHALGSLECRIPT